MGDTVDRSYTINIKRLHSRIYTLRVKQRISITAMKVRLACVSGVIPELQRLIFRGRVLKDDQLLSDYHVEEGNTLYLIVRPPTPRLAERLRRNAAADHILSRGDSQRRHLQFYQNPNLGLLIPDSLTVLTRYLDHLRSNNNSHNGPTRDGILRQALQSRRQLLIGEVAECLSHISMLLVDQVNPTDSSSLRLRQVRAVESEILLNDLGSSLLELGRAISRFSMGERPVCILVHRSQSSQSQLQTRLGARNLPFATSPRNVEIREHIRVRFLWPSSQLSTEEELEESASDS